MQMLLFGNGTSIQRVAVVLVVLSCVVFLSHVQYYCAASGLFLHAQPPPAFGNCSSSSPCPSPNEVRVRCPGRQPTCSDPQPKCCSHACYKQGICVCKYGFLRNANGKCVDFNSCVNSGDGEERPPKPKQITLRIPIRLGTVANSEAVKQIWKMLSAAAAAATTMDDDNSCADANIGSSSSSSSSNDQSRPRAAVGMDEGLFGLLNAVDVGRKNESSRRTVGGEE